MISRAISFFARWTLASILVWASWHKILDPESFARIIYKYHLLPDGLINLSALALPWTEVLVAALLVFGPRSLRRSALWSALLLLAVFTGAVSIKLIQGDPIHCGCFSSAAASGTAIGLWSIVRNLGLMLLGVLALYAESCRKKL